MGSWVQTSTAAKQERHPGLVPIRLDIMLWYVSCHDKDHVLRPGGCDRGCGCANPTCAMSDVPDALQGAPLHGTKPTQPLLHVWKSHSRVICHKISAWCSGKWTALCGISREIGLFADNANCLQTAKEVCNTSKALPISCGSFQRLPAWFSALRMRCISPSGAKAVYSSSYEVLSFSSAISDTSSAMI
jgi:hypothetical protein